MNDRRRYCLYCGVSIGGLHEYITTDGYIAQGVPGIHNDEAWAVLAGEHKPGCEWIETRAHRTGPYGHGPLDRDEDA